MKGNIERVFELRVPVSRAWRAFTEAKELEAWWAPKVNVYEARTGGSIKYAIPGFGEHTGTVLEIESLRFIRQEEGPGHIPGTTELAVTFEEISTGSRIHIVHSGFGDSEKWLGKRESVAQGWSNCIADLALYVETGVRFNRMFTWQWGTSAGFENTLAGPRVVRRGWCRTGGLEYGRRICVEHGARGVERERSPLGREIDPVTHASAWIIAEPIHKGSTGVAPPIGTDVGDQVGIGIHDPHVHLYIDRIDIAAGSIRSTRARPKMVVVAARRRRKGRAAVGIRGNRH